MKTTNAILLLRKEHPLVLQKKKPLCDFRRTGRRLPAVSVRSAPTCVRETRWDIRSRLIYSCGQPQIVIFADWNRF